MLWTGCKSASVAASVAATGPVSEGLNNALKESAAMYIPFKFCCPARHDLSFFIDHSCRRSEARSTAICIMSLTQPVSGNVKYDDAPHLSFTTTVPPNVEKDTIIVAAASPGSDPRRSLAGADNWFLSDFWAFNYLLKGLGLRQTWLTLVVSTGSAWMLCQGL